jgi:outer membrane receptor protein involved in Fe transport
VQDRLDWTGLIVNAGIRFDYFDYKTQRLRNAQLPLDPDSSYLYPSRAIAGSNSQVLDQSDLEPSKKFTRLSPRLGFAFPVTEKTQMRFNYGKFFQRPDLVRLYTGYDYFEWKVRNGGYFYPIGNPNLEPEKTTQYEIGFTHQLGDYTAIDVTTYYKDVTNLVQIINQSSIPNSFAFYQNTDYGTIKGLEFGVSMKRNHNVEMSIKYTMSYANGTGSYANTQSNIAWTASQAPKQTAPLDFDQRHDLVAVVDYRLGDKQGPKFGEHFFLENFGINMVMRAASGTPYTPATVYDEITLNSVNPVPSQTRNSVYGPWTFVIDLKFQKSFKVGTYGITPYITVKNLLNRKNVYVVYESTGRPDNTGWLETQPGQDFVNATGTPDRYGYTGLQEYNLKQQNPLNYGNPRMILFGLRASF